MKIIFIIAFLPFLLSGKCLSQDVFIDKLPAEGFLLDKGWKFQVGNNPDYAKPDFDDSKWQSINPTLDVHDLPQLKQGLVWLRLHLSLDSNILNNQLALSIQQSGASEIFLNGKLIYRFGVLNNDPEKVKAYNPLNKPLSFAVTRDVEQVLAIRYALQQGIFYTTLWGAQNPGLKILVSTTENAIAQYDTTHTLSEKKGIFQTGIFFLLAVLYLAFYLFYPIQKVNLYFSLYAFTTGIFSAVGLVCFDLNYIELSFPLRNFMLIIGTVGNIMLLTAVYRLLDEKKGWIYYCLIAFAIVDIAFGVFVYDGWEIPALLFTNLINFDITRISFKSVRKQKKGAWIIAAGGIAFFMFWIIFSLQALRFIPFYTIDFFNLALFSIPIAVSIYLGYDFSLTNKLLQRKLTEVESLSKEKQQILSQQNEMLEMQVAERTAELKQSLENLKSTQAQLIQSEKMASLGELTAGIAHEIQNPLNFVNNFSEVNTELVDELQTELKAGNTEDAFAISNDIKDNEQKILHQGKRADEIVKGMLQHSRISTGQKELTDINALADEYLRLSYHGMRAKDKSFNADTRTEFDESIGKINIVPQDIGRVLLNLFNNAFYAVMQKKNASASSAGQQYEPTVSVCTKKVDGKIEIHVKDNGNGIPQKIIDKIFQPFFTTKPTGQGTGLGLSLSYDIIKAHGGEIKVETKEGEGSEFVIQLPVV